MTRKCHVGFGEEGACFLPEAIQERRCALTLHQKQTKRSIETEPCFLLIGSVSASSERKRNDSKEAKAKTRGTDPRQKDHDYGLIGRILQGLAL